MSRITIAEAKKLREIVGATHLIAFIVMPDGEQHVVTHGKTEANAQQAADLGNNLKEKLGWPKEFCESKPLVRMCENCSYYKPPYHRPGSPSSGSGHCMWEPHQVPVSEKDKCHHFEPKV